MFALHLFSFGIKRDKVKQLEDNNELHIAYFVNEIDLFEILLLLLICNILKVKAVGHCVRNSQRREIQSS